jgi:predicted transposase YdaD
VKEGRKEEGRNEGRKEGKKEGRDTKCLMSMDFFGNRSS